MIPLVRAWITCSAVLSCVLPASAEEPRPPAVVNGGFENDADGWSDFWSRVPGGAATVVRGDARQGQHALRIEHTGSEDWSFQQLGRVVVEPGDIFELSAWLRAEGEGDLSLSVILYAGDEVLDWSYGAATTRQLDTWRHVTTRFAIPPRATAIRARLLGRGPITAWADGVALDRVDQVDVLSPDDAGATLVAESPMLRAELSPADGSLTITDVRCGRRWSRYPIEGQFLLGAEEAEGGFDVRLLAPSGVLAMDAKIRLATDRPEVTVTLEAEGAMPSRIAYPAAAMTKPGDLLVMPVNEGIAYPVDDETLPQMHYHLYGGHGLCMSWWGITDGQAAQMTLVETPDDAGVQVRRMGGVLCAGPEWQAQLGQFGPPRRLRLVFFDSGGYVAMCKYYRQYAQQSGRLRTLAEKRQANPDVDRLVGAVNVWCWEKQPQRYCEQLQSLGVDRILWSRRAEPDEIERMNAMGVLTSRYDIYQDCMNPANFPILPWRHSDWTSEGWPEDIVLKSDGDWMRGWRVRGKDGQWYPCGVLCDSRALEYARRRVPPELATHAYGSRFIDTTTAAPWRECYHPDHPMTRSESRRHKMDLLAYMSDTMGLVTGSETGHDAAVPVLHYFEGMMSLGPYRIPDAGRAMREILDEAPERVQKFQTGHDYRLPLWELVYHDCIVSYWYWGDYNNKIPSLWDRRDLWNALYGTPPMFMFTRPFFLENQQRFAQSYQAAATVARATGYAEMLSHQWLTEDHAVQQTRFANGVVVTVNFGDAPYTMKDGHELAAMSQRVQGLPTRR